MAELEDVEFLVPTSTPGRRRTRGGSGARCCATWRTRAWPNASGSACTCALANRLSEPASAERYPTGDRVPPGAGRARRAGPEPARPLDRRPGGRGADARGRSGAPADRGASRPPTTTSTRWRSPAPRNTWGEREATILSKLGESLYWLGEYDGRSTCWSERSSSAAIRATMSARTRRGSSPTSPSRSGATPMRPPSMFERALEAARKLDDSSVLARTLLMAGWVPSRATTWTAPGGCSTRRSRRPVRAPIAPIDGRRCERW